MAFNKGTSVCSRVWREQDAIYETSEKSCDHLASLIGQADQNRSTREVNGAREGVSVRDNSGGKYYKSIDSVNQETSSQARPARKLRSIESGGTFIRVTSQESGSSSSKKHQEQASVELQSGLLERKELGPTSRREQSHLNSNTKQSSGINSIRSGNQSSSTDRSSKARLKATTPREANESAMQNHQSHNNHNHYGHRQHASSCAASKLVNHSSTEISQRFKQHRPHCIHHNPHCHLRQQFSRPPNSKELNSSVAQDINISNNNDNNISDNNNSKLRPVKYLKQKDNNNKSYLLVKYRSSQPASSYNNRGHQRNNGRHQEEPASCVFHGNNKRTTIKFISQLYFLLHLSAVLSLLLHHKNLVTNDRKPSQRWSSAATSIDDPNIFNPANHVKKQFASNESSDHHNQQQQGQDKEYQQQMPTDIFSNQLPVPLMQKLNNGQLISSVVVAPTNTYSPNLNSQQVEFNKSRFVRQTNNHNQQQQQQQQQQFSPESPIVALSNSDILVRLVGYFHARCALHYFLCYLLSSSVSILICLRLFRMCNWRKNHVRTSNTNNLSNQIKQSNSSHDTDSSNYGFYYRTRLDCTPVLIGSISLGLIQLIVIGVEIANNVDWLGDNRWPIYLPFLQFAFVSLLMQFILGKVAKNHGHKEQQAPKAIPSNQNTFGNRKSDFVERRRGVSLSINNGKRSASNNGAEVFNFDATTASVSTTKCSPISNGLQNIALAHLLVTHILLWLMKLNSISLFQAIEHQQHLFQHHNNQQYRHQHQHQQQNQQQHHQQHSHLSPVVVDHSSPVSVSVVPTPPLLQNPTLASSLSASTSLISTSPLNPMLEQPILLQTTNLSNLDTSSKPAYGLPINISSNLESDKDHQRSRAELESILRRKPIPLMNRQPDSSSTTTTTTAQPTLAEVNKPPHVASNRAQIHQSNDVGVVNHISGSGNNNNNFSNSSRVEVKFAQPKVTTNETNEVNLKNERGLRSVKRDFLPQTSLADQHKLDSRDIKPSSDLISSKNSTSVTISQEQLLNLLSLASRANDRALASGKTSANSSSNLFKSSLPKRMTAFRQTTRPKVVKETPNSISNSTTQPKVRPKQRARVLITSSDNSLEQKNNIKSDRKQSDDGAKLEVDKKEIATPDLITTERPFPSVESDPPRVEKSSITHDIATVRPASSKVNSTFKEQNSTTESEPKKGSIRGGSSAMKADSGAEISSDDNEDETNHGTPEESGQEEGNDDSELDLDAQLPPVPNYNDTSNDETKRVAAASTSIARVTNDTEPNIIPDQQQLQEEAFVFNEAASNLNVTLSPPVLQEQKSSEKEFLPNSSNTIVETLPSKEALVISPNFDQYQHQHQHQYQYQQQKKQNNKSQSSFADYLLPIVHQYHILIVAILFNMWLDSLRKTKPINAIESSGTKISNSCAAIKDSLTLTSSSSSNAGSASHTSSTKGLIAIPIRNKGKSHRFHYRFDASQHTEPKYPGGVSGFAHDRVHKSGENRWRTGGVIDRKHHRSRSMDFLHHSHHQTTSDELESVGSSLSRFNSLRSSSSERLLWIPKGQFRSRPKSPAQVRKTSNLLAYSDHCSSMSSTEGRSDDSLGHLNIKHQNTWNPQAFGRPTQDIRMRSNKETPANSVCSIFFGLLIVSGSLIVILLGIDLLSTLTQCATQLISILVCLLGLIFTWRSQTRQNKTIVGPLEEGANLRHTNDRLWHLRYKTSTILANQRLRHTRKIVPSEGAGSHRQFFHYLFLLAAYYCGISIALNLTRQLSIQELFSQQVVHFIQRNLARGSQQNQLSMANYLFFFHLVLAIKGLLLIVQVTLQTVLIRSSCQRATRELRQIYTFLMFANLSLWAMEICEQQQHLQRYNMEFDMTTSATTTIMTTTTIPQMTASNNNDKFRLITLDSFTRFAASIVTLSHLYHGLVFMQH